MNHSTIQELETKFAFLERHVEEQDRVILKMQQKIDVLEEKVEKLEDAQNQSQGNSNSQAIDERPPHY